MGTFLKRLAGSRRVMLEIAMAVGLALALWLAGSMSRFETVCGQVRADTLRLHVVAASDSLRDQYIKLQVRDELVQTAGELFAGCQGVEQAKQRAAGSLGRLELTAAQAAARAGFEGPVRVYLTRMYFETREYEEFTLPAGWYDALRVELGDHQGRNWWCVLYPALCLPGCEAEYSQPGEQALIVGEYEVRFALLETWQRLTGRDEKDPAPKVLTAVPDSSEAA